MKIRCYKCHKESKDFDYIVSAAKELCCEPYEYVISYDPEYNPSTGAFLCQYCYIEKLNDGKNSKPRK